MSKRRSQATRGPFGRRGACGLASRARAMAMRRGEGGVPPASSSVPSVAAQPVRCISRAISSCRAHRISPRLTLLITKAEADACSRFVEGITRGRSVRSRTQLSILVRPRGGAHRALERRKRNMDRSRRLLSEGSFRCASQSSF
jgi:hypothetical protein